MRVIEDALASFGLTPTEAKIYLAGLVGRSVSLQDLAKRTKIKRPTLYHALHTLIDKGLVSEKKQSNKSYFSMCEPQMLRGLIEQQRQTVDDRMETLTSLIPLLLKEQGSAKREEINVMQYHGIEGMKTVIDIACYCQSRHWDIIAPYHNFLREYDQAYAQRYLRARKLHRITARTLWELTKEKRPLTPEEVRERNPRIMPTSMQGMFQSMIILFDDKVAMFSSYQKKSAILISSKEIHQMFLAVFNAIWEVSEGYG